MQIIVTWSNGTTSELEVDVPAGATPTGTNFKSSRPDTALHQREDRLWDCYSVKGGGGSIGYCLAPEMVMMMSQYGHPLEGLRWADIWSDPENQFIAAAISRCWWINEEDWERDRHLRLLHAKKFHFNGHATEEEAIHCYQQFLHDFAEQEPI